MLTRHDRIALITSHIGATYRGIHAGHTASLVTLQFVEYSANEELRDVDGKR